MYVTAKNRVLAVSADPVSWAPSSAGGTYRTGTTRADIFSSATGDTMAGGLGDDTYYLWDPTAKAVEAAGEGIDTVYAQYWGAIVLAANIENLFLKSAGSTSGTGNALDNIIVAGTVGATLDGLAGDDVLVGGAGADLFKVSAGNGSDAIYGFTPGTDAIKLQGYGIGSFAQLMSLAVQVGPDTRFDLANGEILVLRGVATSALSAMDFGFLTTPVSTLAGLTTMSGPAQHYAAHGWNVLNNMWNPGTLVSGVDYALHAQFSKSDITAGTTFSWTTPFATDIYAPIRGYPAVIFGGSPYGGGQNPTDTAKVFPVRVSDLTALLISYDVSFSGNVRGFNVAYDIWFTSVPNGGAATITTELMLWVHKGSFEPFGTVIGTYSSADFSGTIYRNGTYVAIVSDHDVPAGKIDLADIVRALTAMGVMSTSEYLASIEFGSEVTYGTGALTINNLDFDVTTPGAEGKSVIKHVTGAATTVEIVDTVIPSPTSVTTELIDYTAAAGVFEVIYTGTAGATLRGNALDNIIHGGVGNDLILIQQGGRDTVYAGAGDDGVYGGAAITAASVLDGGDGNDQLGLQGNYALTLSATTLVNFETLALLSGRDARFGDTAGNLYSYAIRTVDANVAAGQTFVVNASGLAAGEQLTFDGSAETNGQFTIFAGKGTAVLTGGAQNDGFWFGDGSFTAADRVDGGGGTDNQLALSGDYSAPLIFAADSIANIQTIALLSATDARNGGRVANASYTLVLDDANIAAGKTLTVSALSLGASEFVSLDAGRETDGAIRFYGGAGNDTAIGGRGADLFVGGLGADTFTGGAGNDTYIYLRATDSTHAQRDTIRDFAVGDIIDLSRIDANAATGANDAFTFIGQGAFSGIAGQLRVEHSGADWIVQGDVNGDGVADLEILVQMTGTPFVPAADAFIL